jgi:hypothetical protein
MLKGESFGNFRSAIVMKDILFRFFIGGLSVSFFAMVGDVFKPKSFAGLFSAAPSVALATLLLTIASDGRQYAAVEAHSMMVGALAFFAYACCVGYTMIHHSFSALRVSASFLCLWLALALALWFVMLRG